MSRRALQSGDGDTEIRVVDIQELPDCPWESQSVSATRNALGARPERILYLWPFERPDSPYVHLVTNGWVALGPIHLLPSPEARVGQPPVQNRQQIQ